MQLYRRDTQTSAKVPFLISPQLTFDLKVRSVVKSKVDSIKIKIKTHFQHFPHFGDSGLYLNAAVNVGL